MTYDASRDDVEYNIRRQGDQVQVPCCTFADMIMECFRDYLDLFDGLRECVVRVFIYHVIFLLICAQDF